MFILGLTLMILFLGGSLTKIAYYSTVSHRKVLYNTEKEATNTVSLFCVCCHKFNDLFLLFFKLLCIQSVYIT